MKRLGTLLIIAVVVFAIVFFVQRPDILEEVWLWGVGLFGAVVAVFKRLLKLDDKKEDSNVETTSNVSNNSVLANPEIREIQQDKFKGITLTVLRYSDDGTTTVGLLYVNGHYYCYTLEDTLHDEKVSGETRIPAGTYPVDFLRVDTSLTETYRKQFEWFDFHLEIQNIKDFTGVYIHSGGDHTHTKGCLLVSDSLNMSGQSTFFTNSRNTFERLYTYIKKEIDKGQKVRLIVRDEVWFAKLNA